MPSLKEIVESIQSKGTDLNQYLQAALVKPGMLTIQEFIRETKFNIDAFMIDRFWHNLDQNVPIYLDRFMLDWCGYQGNYSKQKDALMKALRSNGINFIELSNDEYKDLLNLELAVQSNTEETKENNQFNWPTSIRTGKGYGRATHILIAPRDFKKMVMRLNTNRGDEIREYFVTLDELFQLYNKYQVLYRDNQLNFKDDKIDKLSTEIQKQTELVQQQSEEIRKLLGETYAQTEQLNRMESSLEVAVEQRVPPTMSSATHEFFVLFRLPQDEHNHSGFHFYVVRSQKVGFGSAIRRITMRYPNAKQVLRIDCQPNSKNLFNRIKERTRNKAVFTYNNIRLLQMKDEDFISIVNTANQEKGDL
jgi:hypothetical protein